MRGAWADSSHGAISVALDAAKIHSGEYVTLEFANGIRLEPLDMTQKAVDVFVAYSVNREQYRATLEFLDSSYEE